MADCSIKWAVGLGLSGVCCHLLRKSPSWCLGPHEVWVSHVKELGGSTTQTFIALGRHRVPRVSSSYFFLFFEPILIFSYFKLKSPIFPIFFLAGEAKIWDYLGVRTCELLLRFAPFVVLHSILLTSLFPLFYITCEFNRFLHWGWPKICNTIENGI